jgi:hypothetical protein
MRHGTRFFPVSACFAGAKRCSIFDRDQLWALRNCGQPRYSKTIHKLLHSFLWISQKALQAGVA